MTIQVPRITDPNDVRQQFRTREFLEEIKNQLFQLTFLNQQGDTTDGTKCYNFDAIWVAYTSNAVADTEDTVPHNLGRIPKGYIVMTADKAGTVYDGTTVFTADNIFLRADVATLIVNLVVF